MNALSGGERTDFLEVIPQMNAERETQFPSLTILEMEDQVRQWGAILLSLACAMEQFNTARLLVDWYARDLWRQKLAVPRRIRAGNFELAADDERNAPECLGSTRHFAKLRDRV